MLSVRGLNKTFKVKDKSASTLFSKKFNDFIAVKDLDLEIGEGEFVAFLGPNGAGKTTTLKMLTGILQPTKGSIDVFGYNPFDRKNEFKRSIAFVMAQKTQLFLELPVIDTFDFIAEIYKVPQHEYQVRLKELVDRFHLRDKLETTGRRLSLGQRMKCELVCSLLYRPRIIFLDEPTIGLDVNSAKEVRSFLKELNETYGTTIVLTTHNMDDVEELCRRTIVINKGEKIYDGSTDGLKKIFGDMREIEFLIDKGYSLKTLDLDTGLPYEILTFQDGKLVIKCEKKDSARIIKQVMAKIEVDEINFKEQELSEVIGKIFTNA